MGRVAQRYDRLDTYVLTYRSSPAGRFFHGWDSKPALSIICQSTFSLIDETATLALSDKNCCTVGMWRAMHIQSLAKNYVRTSIESENHGHSHGPARAANIAIDIPPA